MFSVASLNLNVLQFVCRQHNLTEGMWTSNEKITMKWRSCIVSK